MRHISYPGSTFAEQYAHVSREAKAYVSVVELAGGDLSAGSPAGLLLWLLALAEHHHGEAGPVPEARDNVVDLASRRAT